MQVGFHDQKRVKKVKVEKKMNEIVNRLEKTQKEAYPDLATEKETYEKHVSCGPSLAACCLTQQLGWGCPFICI